MRIHKLKCLPEPFQAMWRGHKRFEIRKNDRDFEEGDILHLKEYDPPLNYPVNYLEREHYYTGQEMCVVVQYIMIGGQHGLAEGYIIMQCSEPFQRKIP